MSIEFKQDDGVLRCVIMDNGIGIEHSKTINADIESKSFSTRAIQEKLELLKKYYNKDIGFYYEDVNEGTKVIIKIPLKMMS